MANIQKELRDTFIFAVTFQNECVAVRIFPQTYLMDSNENTFHISPENYIDQCVTRAIELKSAIECGFCDLTANEPIILNPSIECVDLDFLIQSHVEG